MSSLTIAHSPAEWQSQAFAPGVAPLESTAWQLLQPDAHLLWRSGETVTARCSVWQASLPTHDGVQPTAVGHFAAADADAGSALLGAVTQWRQSLGDSTLIGPVDANTWHKYRLVTGRRDRAPFFLEPDHPPFYVDAWTQAGFKPLAEFHSARMPPQRESDPRLERVQARLGDLGVRIRNLDTSRFSDELRKLYSVSTVSFADNLLYTPIAEEHFLALYAPIRPHIRPEFVWLAEREDQCIGFCFCIPDFNQAQQDDPVDTLIVKSLATLPDRAYAGLGLWLTQIAHQAASAAGFSSVIHALMHPGSRIKHFGKATFDTFRHYTLFERKLDQP